MIQLKVGQIWLDQCQFYRWYVTEVVSVSPKETLCMMRFTRIPGGEEGNNHRCRLYWRHEAWQQRDHGYHAALTTLLYQP